MSWGGGGGGGEHCFIYKGSVHIAIALPLQMNLCPAYK
jgi:hypothetical protein